ncbi:protein-arginine deiminase type-1-like isoform X2 [Numida meleagris]|uniref:protein-arginine deiminase type-1-like isoform X2 n=1 Tax=Numida meleagris TaxID=8996 RepID=UPI000B3E12EC|nr:protein-arginine deiminase type-1-like isoform X2 [Numida meleagris]
MCRQKAQRCAPAGWDQAVLISSLLPAFIIPSCRPRQHSRVCGGMAQQRRVQLCTQRPTSTVCVLGTELSLDIQGSAPKDAIAFHVQGTPGVKVYVVHETQSVKLPSSVTRWPLSAGTEVLLTMEAISKDVGDEKVRVSYFGEASGVPVGRAMLYLTCVEVSLDADTGRSGSVSRTLVDKATWTWGPDGHGAILLVNCDRDDPKSRLTGDGSEPKSQPTDNRDTTVCSYEDLKDMSQMVLRTRGPRTIFTGHGLVLHVGFSDADKVGVFYGGNSIALEEYKHVLGGEKLAYAVKPSRHQEESIFYVEGLAFPDAGFSGLVAFHVTLLESSEKGFLETPIFTDTVVFRVAPWIMTPNTLAPLEVFVPSVEDNEDFVAAISALAEEAKCPVTICPLPENRNDRWIQDEVEFGYVQAPHKTFPVVFDSPRDRGLKDFPVRSILGPDFGYVAQKTPENTSSLDSFGNLEVSPPVTVRSKEYPLGRILIGSSFPRFGGRRMAKAVRNFLAAQRVQAPVELFSDWLQVGHVDEFLSFIPAPDRKSCISWNRDILKRELGLAEQDIIDIPQLFQADDQTRAMAYFPDMVNMLVLGRHLGIPKPFGPLVAGQCCLEERVRALLQPLGLSCTFIDDFFSYHKLAGEVHCGTNVRRKPFAFKWWRMVP